MLTRLAPLLAVAALAACAVAPAAAGADPPLSVPKAALGKALRCPTGLHHTGHNPVLLVHGTATNPHDTWGWNYVRALPGAGYDACTVRLPHDALGDIQPASEYVVYAIRELARRSGRRVSVIGHSQGTIEPRWAIRWWPRTVRPVVADYISMAGPHHGVTAADACAASGSCWPAVWQMASGSKFLGALNAGDETPGRLSYTSVFSDTDELVQPSEPVATAALRGGGANVTNVRVQDVCPGRPVPHGGQVDDAVVWAIVLDALQHRGPAKTKRLPAGVCAREFVPGVTFEQAFQGNQNLYFHAASTFYATPRGATSEPPLRAYARHPG
jgi:hypothetical protein